MRARLSRSRYVARPNCRNIELQAGSLAEAYVRWYYSPSGQGLMSDHSRHALGERRVTTVLVTGAAGFIGGYATEELLARGYDVIGLDNFSKYGESEMF